MSDSSIHSFLHTIHPSYTPAYRVITPYKIKVSYKHYYNDKVVVESYGIHPGIVGRIQNWPKLIEEIQAAAEVDRKKYLRPGQYRGSGKIPQPGEDPHHDTMVETKWK